MVGLGCFLSLNFSGGIFSCKDVWGVEHFTLLGANAFATISWMLVEDRLLGQRKRKEQEQ